MDLFHNKRFKTFFVLYLILNILVTYTTTTQTLNKYIVTFTRTPLTEISSILGNAAILMMLLLIGMLIFKKERGICGYMLVITFLLNLMMYAIGYFTKNYKTMFSLHNFTLFRNPDAGFASQVIIDAVKELIFYYRIICFIPFIVMLIYYLCTQRSFQHKYYHCSLITKFIVLLSSLILSILSVIYFEAKLAENWEYRTEVPQYGCQVCGIYNYFFAELFYGVDYSKNYVKDDIELIEGQLSNYDKNKDSYTNILDGLTYYKSTSGPLAGMNVFMIQAESVQTFALDYKYTDKDGEEQYLMPYMRELLNLRTTNGTQTSFFFSNAHTVVGLGNTSDAEFAVNTGFYPMGDATIAWEAYDREITMSSLAGDFGDSYTCYSYNPTLEEFYAHKFVHENLYGFDQFRGIESYRKDYPQVDNPDDYLRPNWVSDKYMLEYAESHSLDVLSAHKSFYTFIETISPHLPFDDLSHNYPSEIVYDKIDFGEELSDQFQNYLNQIHFNDKVLYNFIRQAEIQLPNTVFVVYGDHGNTLGKEYYDVIFDKELTDLEYRKILLNIPIIFYDPSGKLGNYCNSNRLDLNYVLNRTVSQIDIYSTIHTLFGLETDSYMFGVNLFSSEPSFAVDPKNLDIVTDDFMYSLKNKSYVLFNENYSEEKMQGTVKEISNFKLYSDYYMSYMIDNAAKREHENSKFFWDFLNRD